MKQTTTSRFAKYLQQQSKAPLTAFKVTYLEDPSETLIHRRNNALRRVIEVTNEYINKNKL